MKITWMGTASFVIETEEARLLFDPFVQLRGGEHPNTLDDFLSEDVIFITHGHFDHLLFVPEILEQSQATVFCTKVPAQTLENITDCTDRIAVFETGQTIPIGDMQVCSYPSRHIRFDPHYIGKTVKVGDVLKNGRNLPFLLYANRRFEEGGETIAYEIRAKGRRILLFGSLNMDEEVSYPTEPDVLILPYQGCNDLVEAAGRIIGRIRPRHVLLSHFDNAFPPLSRTVDLRPLKQMMQENWPHIQLVRPVYGQSMNLKDLPEKER